VAPKDAAPPDKQEDRQAASGRPVGDSTVSFGTAALKLLDNGYEPLPIRPREKVPAVSGWQKTNIDAPTVERWAREYRGSGIGLRTGRLVVVDIDLLDPDRAHQVGQLVQDRLGTTLVRFGRWPKRALLYRTDTPFAKMSLGGVEILGRGQQMVAFGIHPGTGRPYDWPLGDSPLDVVLADLPRVDEERCRELLVEIAALLPSAKPPSGPRKPGSSSSRTAAPKRQPGSAAPVRDERGFVVDGRDGWLSVIAYHAVQDALAAGGSLDRGSLVDAAWRRFQETADLGRPNAHGERYGPRDAERKVQDKLRLLAEGRLPRRDTSGIEADYVVPRLMADQARGQLDVLQEACERFEAWHAAPDGPCPQIGVRATVGLGKSAQSRKALVGLQQRLRAAGAPSRILVLVPTHELAEETAGAWRHAGAKVAVHRGYEAKHPVLGASMCQDLEAVRAAIAGRFPVHETACAKADRRCAHFERCPKQQNRLEVAPADIVVAVHDVLFTGFAIETSSIGVILIDEGCWQRAIRSGGGLHVEDFPFELIGHSLAGPNADDEIANLNQLRRRAVRAMVRSGPVARSALVQAGLDAQACERAIQLEERRLRDPGLFPGMPAVDRKPTLRRVRINERTYRYIEVWRAMQHLAAGEQEHDGRLHVHARADGRPEIVVTGLKPIHPTLRDRPVLLLDATLRPELARSVLPNLSITEIDAVAPHMSVRLVTGSFGKGQLCPGSRLDDAEAQRRRNRLAEVMDYVRWQARRVVPDRVLVVTYKDIEDAFSGIPGVETAHFNAIAGLDAYRDVRLLIVVGRPLPSHADLTPLSGAFFRHLQSGGYQQVPRGVRMRGGSACAVQVRLHADEKAEVLRAAICDDQLIQAIGRGRGINRTEADPLEVHVLADVALPLVHDQVVPWDAVVPDLLQRMLLAGVAVDSPGDAARLHSDLFGSPAQAEKAFQRDRFGGQNPIRDIYREMSVKSAAYRRPGRGCSWQRAWWIEGESTTAEKALVAALGPLAAWRPSEQ
jgi:hypothetical protein